MDRLIIAIATGLYSGMGPKAPGTWGSLFAMLPWFFCRNLALPTYLVVMSVLFVIGFLTAGSAEKIFDRPDPGCIVIDEILGIFITLTLAPDHPLAWILGFLLFRLFDVLKPFPVSWLDTNLHGGIGIMMDDVMAGIYALISLQLIWVVVGRLV
jgi:phosphatidylglycerophosphatase A